MRKIIVGTIVFLRLSVLLLVVIVEELRED